MEIGIIGASAAGLYAAALLARKRPDFHIVLIDGNDKPGKKLLATGNGHCNLFNASFAGKFFNHPEFVDPLLTRFPKDVLMDELHGMGIATLEKDGLVYPLSYSAASHVRYLVGLLEKLGVKFRLGEKVIGAKGTRVETEKGTMKFDHLIYAFGGCSQSNLGSDGSLFAPLKKNGYDIVKLEPSLCPLYSRDVPKSLFGVRHKCVLTLTKNKKDIYQENGEVLFKKDGLSGIAVMNASSHFGEGSSIRLDLFPDLKESELLGILDRSYRQNPEDFLAPILERPLAEFILQKCGLFRKNGLSNPEIANICAFMKCLEFRVDSKYDFASSQVTRGGVSLQNVDLNLASKIEGNVSFVGECLDVDGMCGGFNLGWALLSAKVVSESL